MAEQANAAGARLVTTAKDAVRLPFGARAMVEVVTIKLEFEQADALDHLLAPVIDR
jgi:tetraacyldisaccharide-1-P 4'-kinase